MIRTPSKVSLKNLIKHCEISNSKLEEKYPIIRDMLNFDKLPPIEQMAQRKEWDEYYAGALKTEAYKNFVKQGKAFAEGNMAAVKRLARNKSNDSPREKPPGTDPWEFSQNYHCKQYRYNLAKIEGIKKDLQRMGDEDAINEEVFS